jgi:hypothetical protein
MPLLRERRDQRNDTGAGWYFWLRDGQWPSAQQLLRKRAVSGEHAVGFARQLANLPIDKRKAAFDAMPDVKKKGSAKPFAAHR